jgi:hypothetical protein
LKLNFSVLAGTELVGLDATTIRGWSNNRE